MSEQETYERFWEEAATRMMHPVQLLVLEALSRIELPVSAKVMEQVSGEQIPLANFSYHITRLASLGLLELVDAQPRRGVSEKFYDLRMNGSGEDAH